MKSKVKYVYIFLVPREKTGTKINHLEKAGLKPRTFRSIELMLYL